MNDPTDVLATRRLAQALYVNRAVINVIDAAMRQADDPAPEALVAVLQSAFPYLIQRHGARNVRAAAQIVEHATDLLSSELSLVDDEIEPEP